ncbi:conserved hypothetical protein [Parafrankia sp. Ea1.12]|nr:conserved hypothetical protein [Parafrankia sp. Ea1.12]
MRCAVSLQPQPWPEVPAATAKVARKAFRKGTLAMRIRDELGPLFADEQFAAAFATRGRPGLSPGQLALVCVLQFAENLSDRQAALQAAARIDWKYALGLELDDAGFDYSVLSGFRARLVEHGLEATVLDLLLARLSELGLLRAGGRARTDSTHVLAAVRSLVVAGGPRRRRPASRVGPAVPPHRERRRRDGGGLAGGQEPPARQAAAGLALRPGRPLRGQAWVRPGRLQGPPDRDLRRRHPPCDHERGDDRRDRDRPGDDPGRARPPRRPRAAARRARRRHRLHLHRAVPDQRGRVRRRTGRPAGGEHLLAGPHPRRLRPVRLRHRLGPRAGHLPERSGQQQLAHREGPRQARPEGRLPQEGLPALPTARPVHLLGNQRPQAHPATPGTARTARTPPRRAGHRRLEEALRPPGRRRGHHAPGHRRHWYPPRPPPRPGQEPPRPRPRGHGGQHRPPRRVVDRHPDQTNPDHSLQHPRLDGRSMTELGNGVRQGGDSAFTPGGAAPRCTRAVRTAACRRPTRRSTTGTRSGRAGCAGSRGR